MWTWRPSQGDHHMETSTGRPHEGLSVTVTSDLDGKHSVIHWSTLYYYFNYLFNAITETRWADHESWAQLLRWSFHTDTLTTCVSGLLALHLLFRPRCVQVRAVTLYRYQNNTGMMCRSIVQFLFDMSSTHFGHDHWVISLISWSL